MDDLRGIIEEELHIVHKAEDGAVELRMKIGTRTCNHCRPGHGLQDRSELFHCITSIPDVGQRRDPVPIILALTRDAVGTRWAGRKKPVLHAEARRPRTVTADQQHRGEQQKQRAERNDSMYKIPPRENLKF